MILIHILEKIELNRSKYTKAELKICDYILKNPHMVEEITVSRIADYAKSSKSAVLRFCQKLGYSGYSEFRFDFIRSLHSLSKKNHLNEEISLLKTYSTLFSGACLEMANLPEQELLHIIQLIHEAPIIRAIGMMRSMLPVIKLDYDFTSLGKNVLTITDNITPGLVSGITSSDLIVYFSVSGRISSPSIKDFLDSAQDKNCKIVLVTCNPKGQIAKYSSHTIILSKMQLPSGMSIDVHALMIAFVDILVGYYKSELLS